MAASATDETGLLLGPLLTSAILNIRFLVIGERFCDLLVEFLVPSPYLPVPEHRTGLVLNFILNKKIFLHFILTERRSNLGGAEQGAITSFSVDVFLLTFSIPKVLSKLHSLVHYR